VDKTAIYRAQPVCYRVLGPDRGSHAVSKAALSVLLIHGFAEDGQIWDEQVECLKKDFQLIIPDLPGSGNSPLSDAATSMEYLAEVIKIILDAERIDRAVLIGHSMGGYALLAFVEKYPGRCKAFGLFHSTAYPDNDEKKAFRRKSMDFIHRHGAAEFIRGSTPNLFAESSRQQHPEWVSRTLERYSGFDPKALINYYQAMIDRPDRTEVLARSTVPVLFVIGRQDATLPLEAALNLTHLPALSIIHILDQAGHMGMIEDAARSNDILAEFLTFIDARDKYIDQPGTGSPFTGPEKNLPFIQNTSSS
jgi:pimeloyl-ACP methyl ester carboxylesterase